MYDWIFNIPLVWSSILFILSIVFISLISLTIFKHFNIDKFLCQDNNTIVEVFTSIIAVFLGIFLTFTVIDSWKNFNQTQLNSIKEAKSIFMLSQTLNSLPNTKKIIDLIIQYIKNIINIEYPMLKEGKVVSWKDPILSQIESKIYSLNSNTSVYNESIKLLNNVIFYRIDRINSGTNGVNKLVWWITVINSVLIITTSWFLNCNMFYYYILEIILTVYIASSLLLILIFSYPFRGDLGLQPTPFKEVLEDINVSTYF